MRPRRSRGLLSSRRRIVLLAVVLVLAAYRYLAQTGLLLPSDTAPCPENQEHCFQGNVTRVVDGDTLDVGGTRVRLVLVDAPEGNTRAGAAATRYLRDLCAPGSAAQVQRDWMQPVDQYGRTLGVVWCVSRNANEEMIRSGHAQLYRRFCRQSAFGLAPWAVALGCA